MRLAAWNRDCKGAALIKRALDPHTAAVQFDQLLNECQSDSCAFMSPRAHALDAMKALEHPLALFAGDSHACVADLQFHCAVYSLQCERNLALERELQGVGEQIQDDLLPHVAVHINPFDHWLGVH